MIKVQEEARREREGSVLQDFTVGMARDDL